MSAHRTQGSTRSDWPIRAPLPRSRVEPGERPTLSVFIPYYRGADVIRQAVESALDQTLPPDEIVICDDGSPDDLEAALGPLRERVTIVRKENGGVASAMNAATRAARGEFVVWLDQDDAFLPRRLEAIATAAASRPDVDVIATDALIEYEGETIATFAETIPFETERQREVILRTCFCCWPAIRRSRLLAAGGFDEEFKILADWDCFVRLIGAGAVVAQVEEPLYRYRLTPGSLLSDRVAREEEFECLLRKAVAQDNLAPSGRSLAEAGIAWSRRTRLAHEARKAILAGSRDARWRSLRVVVGRGFPVSSRVKAAVAVLLPGLARKALAERADRRGAAHEAFVARIGGPPPSRSEQGAEQRGEGS